MNGYTEYYSLLLRLKLYPNGINKKVLFSVILKFICTNIGNYLRTVNLEVLAREWNDIIPLSYFWCLFILNKATLECLHKNALLTPFCMVLNMANMCGWNAIISDMNFHTSFGIIVTCV